MKYRMTAGFETHVELLTDTKIFCSCKTQFGGTPNSHCCPVCIGLPGALPSLNKRVVEYAVKAGLALNCRISNISNMDRKNYSYPDLPKAYQISQFDMPLCEDGYIELNNGKRIGITRIHIEEDAGKLIHKDDCIYVDYNRAGVPLIEIVSEPDIASVQEAKEYVEKLRLIMRSIGISDCKMQEGSMRCDVNVSVAPINSEVLGTRTEIKNMNSIANIAKAMEYEYSRQIKLFENGERVVQETLGFDEKTGTTYSMRTKEDADDYRFFREPDLLSVIITDEEIERIRQTLPELPHTKAKRFEADFGLEEKDALLLVKYPKVACFFEAASQGVKNPKSVANFILGPIFASLKTEALKEEFNLRITPEMLKGLVLLTQSGKISNNMAKSVLSDMLVSGKSADAFISEADTNGLSDSELLCLCQNAVEANPKIVSDFKGGKDKAIMALLGAVMRESKGRADANKAKTILVKLLNE